MANLLNRNLQLPTARTTIETDLSKYIIFLYGREKIGKTTLAAQFPDALFLMLEPGGKSLELFRMEINTWQELVEATRLLQESNRFKTIVVDTIDIAFKLCSDYWCKKLAISHPSEEEWGKAYGLIRDEFQKLLSTLGKLNRGLILISHAEERDVKRLKTGDGFSVSPTLSKQGRRVVEPMVDIWGYYGYDGTNRTLQIRGNEEVHAGCRLERNFVGIDSIPMGSSAKQAYQNFMLAFQTKEVRPPVAVPVKKFVVRRK